MVIESFTFTRTPRIHFGPGALQGLGEIAAGFGDSVLLVTGKSSFLDSGGFCALSDTMNMDRVRFHPVTVQGEPSPDMVDEVVGKFGGKGIDVVVAIGGGSVMDAGKAISAMLPLRASVLDYLEGVGTGAVHDGSKVPFIAVPTTAGTGSEATKNAVLSRVGPDGFKKSLRHDHFVPDVALVDPKLAIACPAPARRRSPRPAAWMHSRSSSNPTYPPGPVP
jgi:alcohol dehydrogenase class IV